MNCLNRLVCLHRLTPVIDEVHDAVICAANSHKEDFRRVVAARYELEISANTVQCPLNISYSI